MILIRSSIGDNRWWLNSSFPALPLSLSPPSPSCSHFSPSLPPPLGLGTLPPKQWVLAPSLRSRSPRAWGAVKVWLYAYMYVWMDGCTHVCLWACVYACMYVWEDACMHVCVHVCVCVCVCVCVWCVCVCVCVHVYMRATSPFCLGGAPSPHALGSRPMLPLALGQSGQSVLTPSLVCMILFSCASPPTHSRHN